MVSILLWIFLILFLIIVCIFLVTYAFVNDFKTTIDVFKESFRLAFNKAEQEKAIDQTTDFLNSYFKQMTIKIVESKNDDLSKKLDLSKEEVADFKSKMNQLLKDSNLVYISKDSVRVAVKKNKSFNFFNLLVNNTQKYSSDRLILLKKLNDEFKAGKISEEAYSSEMLKLGEITPKEAKVSLKKRTKRSRTTAEQVLPFVQKLINQNDNIQAMYKFSMHA